MTYETLNSINVITGIASLVMLAVTVGLFFLLKIPEAVAFISGRTRKKGIEAIQRTGTVGSASVAPRSRKLERTARITVQRGGKDPDPVPEQGRFTDVMPASEHGSATGHKNTEVLSSVDRLTTVLDGKNGNAVLESAQVDHQNLVFTQQPFVVEFDITYVYSDIIIGEV